MFAIKLKSLYFVFFLIIFSSAFSHKLQVVKYYADDILVETVNYYYYETDFNEKSGQNNREENNSIEIKAYPNPVTDVLYVENSIIFDKIIIKKYTGEVILEDNKINNLYSLNFSSYTKGVYLIEFYNDSVCLGSKCVVK